MKSISIGKRVIGNGHPTFIVGEIGINHNGDLDVAMRLIDAAVSAGCDAVKFQKRTPALCVPPGQQDQIRETPWGDMTYLAYRARIEFDEAAYRKIDDYCRDKKIPWFASCWDIPSVDFIRRFDPPCYKIASANLTDTALVSHVRRQNKPVILSTGMSTMEEITESVHLLAGGALIVAHSTSSYACCLEELNLRMITTLQQALDLPVGYSGHEEGILPSCLAVALGAVLVERHITLDRTMWGSDQKASLEPADLRQLVADIRQAEKALGDGVKQVYDTELESMARLRR